MGDEVRGEPRLRVFRGSEATALGPETMGTGPVSDEVRAGLARLAEAGVVAGKGEKNLLLFGRPGEDGPSLVYLWFKSGYVLPPHRHDGDCLYYILAGSLRIGKERLGKGDGLFVPAQAAYAYEAGPQGVELLEFRNATQFSISLMGGREGAWDRMIRAFRDNAQAWRDELPPSAR
ncbi:hypothetical protein C3942_06540 [Solimonas fluminis]|uniref:Cupin domain-containing protein n=1 Tax=Solimonas fluminis TaxID=2086571 RepID=A0A2S5THG0_9GAMM|nr:hypothetical protein [Solimonas fluminis]PPE74420.1 hypothetical protein C3942_06540 [Solimonas fluminis]